jgi:hypothetical protein
LPRLATRCPGIDASEGWPIILALIAEFENDIRRERQMDGIAKAKERGIKFGCKLELTPDRVAEIKTLRAAGTTVTDTTTDRPKQSNNLSGLDQLLLRFWEQTGH